MGNWKGDYSGGTAPQSWTGSFKIMNQFYKSKRPVKFGQCWVFAGVTTTSEHLPDSQNDMPFLMGVILSCSLPSHRFTMSNNLKLPKCSRHSWKSDCRPLLQRRARTNWRAQPGFYLVRDFILLVDFQFINFIFGLQELSCLERSLDDKTGFIIKFLRWLASYRFDTTGNVVSGR